MKYLVIVCSLIICVSVCNSQLNNTQDLHNEYENFIRINIPNDTILNLINENTFLYYTKGHHGHIWSLIIKDNNHYILVAGSTRNNNHHIDTLFIDKPVLTWGMDSLAMSCHKMKPVYRKSFWPFYERLVLFSAEKAKIFDCTNALCYSGIDSASFNEKLNRLKYYMYWIAAPIEVQEKLPDPL